jgi:hypothetical protein
MTGEGELLEELGRLVESPFRDPPPESLDALRSIVRRQFSPGPRRPWWRNKVTVGAAVVALLTGAPAAAYAASGAPLPDSLRTAMHAVGLPVDPMPVAKTKAAESTLRAALLRQDDASAIKAAATHLQACLSDLNATERNRLAPGATALLQSAAASTHVQAPLGTASSSGYQSGDRPAAGHSSDGGDADTAARSTSQPYASSSPADRGGLSGPDDGQPSATGGAGDGSRPTQRGWSGGGDGSWGRTDPTTDATNAQPSGEPGSTTTDPPRYGSGEDRSGQDHGAGWQPGNNNPTTTTTTAWSERGGD